MRADGRGRHISVICACSMALCLLLMCAQVNECGISANVENTTNDKAVYANAEITEGLSLKEKVYEDSSAWGKLAQKIWDMVEAWRG